MALECQSQAELELTYNAIEIVWMLMELVAGIKGYHPMPILVWMYKCRIVNFVGFGRNTTNSCKEAYYINDK